MPGAEILTFFHVSLFQGLADLDALGAAARARRLVGHGWLPVAGHALDEPARPATVRASPGEVTEWPKVPAC